MHHNTKKYDYLIVGAGPFGTIFAHEAADRGKRSLIIERRSHLGGNMHTHKETASMSMITVHISSIRITNLFGITLTNSPNLTAILTKLSQITKEICIACPLI